MAEFDAQRLDQPTDKAPLWPVGWSVELEGKLIKEMDMGIDLYRVQRDHFELDDAGMRLCFPCSVCKHRHGSDKDEPCIRCDWNMGALPDDELPPNALGQAGRESD